MSQEELFQKYISATMTLEDKEELKELLKTDKEAGREFAEYIEDTAMYLSVAEELALHQKAVDLDRNQRSATANFKIQKATTARVMPRTPNKTVSRVLFTMAAALTVCGILFYNYLKNSRHVADVVLSGKISLDRAGLDLTFGNKSFILNGDRLTALDDIKVDLIDGSSMTMKKGAICEIQSTELGLEVKQVSGRSEFDVVKQAGGKKFRVLTDKVRTTVIGTRFTVDADTDRSKIRVTEGLVKVDDLISKSYFVNPGELAIIDADKILTKKVAYQAMLLNKFVTDAKGRPYNVESIEEKPYLILLYAQNWDPVSRSFIHKLKKYYSGNSEQFEVIFMNDKDNFASDYDMPWACIDSQKTTEVENLVGEFHNSYTLNLVLMDQHGNVIAKSAKGSEWLGADHVLDTLDGNLNR